MGADGQVDGLHPDLVQVGVDHGPLVIFPGVDEDRCV